MKYFVSADIYGFYDEWQLALKEKGFDINNSEHKIILCGDLFDRGRQPKEIIDFVLTHKDKVILIRGNHEDLMQEMIDRNNATFGDLSNGTSYTIVDLYPEWQISEFNLSKIAKETRLQEVLDMCIDYFETEHYIFVHGWIPIIENCYFYDSEWRSARKERWEKVAGQTLLKCIDMKFMSQTKQSFADIGTAQHFGTSKTQINMKNLAKTKTLNHS